jgi:hypothetical protein
MRDTLHAIHSGSNLDTVEEEEIRFIWNENSLPEIPSIEKLNEFEARRGRIPFYTNKLADVIDDNFFLYEVDPERKLN